ncbi:MAG: ABC transporter ATP-binding protein/permease [Xanthobacteraceae bacterium]|nr:ABC transporter ATP-binding protein/permease [Xanthobacteraceae bacterium]
MTRSDAREPSAVSPHHQANSAGTHPPAGDRPRTRLARRFWASALGFWRRGGSRAAWPLTIGLVVLIVANLALDLVFNRWSKWFFDALEQKDAAALVTQALIFVPLATGSVTLGVTNVWLRMTLQRAWRAWTNAHLLDGWLAHDRYYQLNLVRGEHQNPEYRIAEDLRVATEAPVDFAAGLLIAVLSAAAFIVVLWTIGGSLTLSLGGVAVTIPGFLVLGAIAYALVGTAAMLLVGRRFIEVSEDKNQAEAEYRYVLQRVRENGESIALLGGEAEERAGLERSFAEVLRHWRALCVQYMRTTAVSHTSGLVVWTAPVLLAAPKYLDGSMTLGAVMQATSAFVIVQKAFGWIVDNYPYFANWSASAHRVAALQLSLDALAEGENNGSGHIGRGVTQDAALQLRDLSVTLDDGTSVVDGTEVTIAPGEKVLVVGESGTGKSTLVRAIAGLWPWGQGEILFGRDARLFLLPQRPYIPTGTLRRAATYPAPADQVDRQQVAELVEAVGLGYLAERLDEPDVAWDHVLSGGEKQRLSFARLLIHRPSIAVIDEGTSALDRASQEQMMRLVAERLPQTTLISVGHRPELEAFHDRELVMEWRPGGARLVRDIDLTSWRTLKPWRWGRRPAAAPRAAG